MSLSVFRKFVVLGSMLLTSLSYATTVYDFEGSIQGWQGQSTAYGPWAVNEWSSSGSYSLKADVWLYDHAHYVLKLTQNQNFQGKKFLKATVRRSSWGNWNGFTAKIYVKTGDNWQWYDGGLVSVTTNNQDLCLDISTIPNCNYIREIGVEFETWGACNDRASIYLDNVRFENECMPNTRVVWSRDGKYVVDSEENVFVAGLTINKINPVNGNNVWSVPVPTNTPALSVALHNNNLFAAYDNGTWQLNKNNGSIIWSNSFKADQIYSNTAADRLLLLDKRSGNPGSVRVVCVNPANGTPVWSKEFVYATYSAEINYADQNVVVFTSPFVNGSTSEVLTYIININTGIILWSTGNNRFLAADATGLYTRNANTNNLSKYNLANGVEIWNFDNYVTELMLRDSYLYLNTLDYTRIVYKLFRLNPENKNVIWSIDIPNNGFNLINILSNGSLIAKNATITAPITNIYKVNDGTKLLGAPVPDAILEAGSDVITIKTTRVNNAYVQRVSLVNPVTAVTSWSFDPVNDRIYLPYPNVKFLKSDDQTVYIYAFVNGGSAAIEGKMYALNRTNGTIRWAQEIVLNSINNVKITSQYLYLTETMNNEKTYSFLK
jgi:hypothetical protein